MGANARAEVPAARYFRVSAMAGRLHLSDVGNHAAWDPERITYEDTETVTKALRSGIGDHVVNTAEELDAALEASKGRPGSQTVWAHERLLNEVRRHWEEMKQQLEGTL